MSDQNINNIQIYSSLTRKKEQFTTINENEVKMYACGVTPYDEIHIGHARQAVVYDVMRAYFEYVGFKVNYVRNFTDVDDKIILRANKEGKQSSEVSEYYIAENSRDLEKLMVKKATREPKVTECISEIIKYIEVLIKKEFAYESSGEVLFDIKKFNEYGKLSNRNTDELINSEKSENKKNNNDFVLWKPHKKGEPYWESPWGNGRPGWHIECSVMAHIHLGDQIDIHGGGIDLIFPHHENELAQSEAFTGKQFAKYWAHNGLVMVNGTKMSKSLDNFMTVKDALNKYFPEEIRYVILTHNFGSNVDFSDDLFLNARKRLHYFYTSLLIINKVISEERNEDKDKNTENTTPSIIATLEEKFREYMNDNFNTPRVIAEINDVFKELNKIIDSKNYSDGEKNIIFRKFLVNFNKIGEVLRLFNGDGNNYLNNLKTKLLAEKNITEEFINEKISELKKAKEDKNYVLADAIKTELKKHEIIVQESKNKITWEFEL